jgi:DNA segregation ATPase FtsK/SpoIIIE, S-DNA-T family
MQIVFQDDGQQRELDLELNNPSATVADLAAALDPAEGPRRQLVIGGLPADPDLDIHEAGIHEGAEVRFSTSSDGRLSNGGQPDAAVGRLLGGPRPAGSTGRNDRGAEPAIELVVINGLDAGRRCPVTKGTTLLGRSRDCDVQLNHATVSKRHAGITAGSGGEITVDDLGSHNGTWVDGDAVTDPTVISDGSRLRLGALELEIRVVRDDDRPMTVDPLRDVGVGCTIPFNRPPRPAPPPPLQAIHAPKAPRESTSRGHGSIMMMIGPVVMGGVGVLTGW